jgi:peptidoglycan/xylan/chitin deacetylase (PgdA/CDA1 family)
MPVARALLYAATAAVLVLTGRAVLVAPPPLAWAIAALAAYVALVLAGVLVLPLRVFADAIVRGPKDARGVALTFDDGPDPEWTPRVLDLLDAADAKATFFVIGRKVDAHADVVREIVRRGHALGLHSYEHDRLFSLRGERRVKSDLERGLAAIERVTGVRPSIFRPPIGHTNPVIARVADAMDLAIVGWSVSGRDGVRADPARVAARVRGGLRDGAIVLLHDAAERGDREPAAVRALPEILRAIDAQNLRVAPLASFLEERDQASGSST